MVENIKRYGAKVSAIVGAGLAFLPSLALAAGPGDLITTASNGFASTTGMGISDVVDWAGDNLIKLFIGSGLALLYNLRYWIVALVIFAAIIYFSFRAFRFFKH